MRTLYYKIEVVRSNEDKLAEDLGYEYSRSEGILKVECDKKGIKNIEGVLNLDIIVSEVQGDSIVLKYYIPNKNFDSLRLDAQITFEPEEIEIPINFQSSSGPMPIEIRTISKITDPSAEEYYNKKLEEVKNIMVHI